MIINSNDTKAMEIAVEVLLRAYLNTLRAVDIEDLLEGEFDDYTEAEWMLQEVVKEYCKKKGL